MKPQRIQLLRTKGWNLQAASLALNRLSLAGIKSCRAQLDLTI